MTREMLADRTVTYADTIVAFSLVNGFAFLITLGEPDIRCSIANVSAVAFTLNLAFPVLGTYAVLWLRRFEHRLRTEAPEAVTAPPPDAEPNLQVDPVASPLVDRVLDRPVDPLVDRFWRIAFIVRITLIWIFAALVIIGIFGATQDGRCTVPLG